MYTINKMTSIVASQIGSDYDREEAVQGVQYLILTEFEYCCRFKSRADRSFLYFEDVAFKSIPGELVIDFSRRMAEMIVVNAERMAEEYD